jgi:hypothetical protein
LALEGNKIGDEGAKFLANASEKNTVRELLYSSITRSSSSFKTDTYNVGSWKQRNQR